MEAILVECGDGDRGGSDDGEAKVENKVAPKLE
jgi:hypothetical protein